MFRIFKSAVYFLNKKQLFTKAAQLSEHNLEFLIVSLFSFIPGKYTLKYQQST